MLRFSKHQLKKWGQKEPLRAPRRNKEYKYVYNPYLRQADKHILEQNEEAKRKYFGALDYSKDNEYQQIKRNIMDTG